MRYLSTWATLQGISGSIRNNYKGTLWWTEGSSRVHRTEDRSADYSNISASDLSSPSAPTSSQLPGTSSRQGCAANTLKASGSAARPPETRCRRSPCSRRPAAAAWSSCQRCPTPARGATWARRRRPGGAAVRSPPASSRETSGKSRRRGSGSS